MKLGIKVMLILDIIKNVISLVLEGLLVFLYVMLFLLLGACLLSFVTSSPWIPVIILLFIICKMK